MRIPWLLLIVFTASPSIRAAAPDEAPAGKKDVEDRLLEAELLEVSTGDLEKAKAIYQAIQADEKTPEPARARALLYLARCHRKLGEIEAARKLLEELVKNRAAEREVLRQAQGFLRELTGGRPESPEFDWLKELERNPEIQARVFDLAMDLVDPKSESTLRAQRQLLALGPLAVPVMEKVIETTRDPEHRQLLAILLLHSGRFERLGLVLGPDAPTITGHAYQALYSFRRSVSSLPEEVRRRLREAIGKLPPSSAGTASWRDLLLLEAGDTSNVAEKLKRTEGQGLLDAAVFERLLAREPAATEVLAARILDPQCPKQQIQSYLDVLLDKSPEKLSLAHWKALFGAIDPGKRSGYFKRLEKRGDFDVLASLAGERIEGINPSKDFKWFGEDPRWSRVLRAQKRFEELNTFAEVVDGAIPELVAVLKARAQEAPEYLGNHSHTTQDGSVWTPSPAYAEAMVGLLGEKDPVVLAIALEALAAAPPEPKAEQAIREVLRGTEDLHAKEFALYALLRRSGGEGENGAAAARALFEEFQARSELYPQAYFDSPLIGATSIGHASPRSLPNAGNAPVPGRRPPSFPDTLGWVSRQAGEKVPLALYPHVLTLAGSAGGAAFHEWFLQELSERTPRRGSVEGVATRNPTRLRALRILLARLDSLSGPEIRESLMAQLGTLELRQLMAGESASLLKFLKEVVRDRALPTKVRTEAFFFRGKPDYDWLDWPALFASDDPLATSFFEWQLPVSDDRRGEPADSSSRFWKWVSSRPEGERAQIEESALKSPQEAVRASAVGSLGRAESPEVLRRALADPSPNVKWAAFVRLENTSRADLAPLAIELLARDANRLSAIKMLKRFAVPQSIEPLVKLLDDPDIEVRSEARAALKEIRAALEEKKEWEQVLKGIRPPPAEKPREP